MNIASSSGRDWEDCAPPNNLGFVAVVTIAVGALIGLTVWGVYDSDAGAAKQSLDIAVGIVSVALLPVTLRWPLAGGIALGVLAALSPAATPAATFAALFAARERRYPIALTIAAVGIAGHAVQGWWRPTNGLPYGWFLLLVFVAYAALVGWGALAQARAALLMSLRERAYRAEAEQGRRVAEARIAERTKIAREMHDVLAHRLSLIATYAGALEYRPDAPPEQVSLAAGVVRDGVHQALDELRTVIRVLRDDETDIMALDGDVKGQRLDLPDSVAPERPQPVLSDVDGLVDESRDAGTRVRLDNRIDVNVEMPTATGRTAYRVVQEGLTNARKHAAGLPVVVVLDGRAGARLTVDVRNPMPSPNAASGRILGSGTGLVGLTERVQLAGGELDHEVTADGEFRLRASIPWPV